MRRVPLSSLLSLLLVGLLQPMPWTEVGQAHATSGGVPPFKGIVIKCVGFNLLFDTERAGVYVHNDGSSAAVARVRFLDSGGTAHSSSVSTILAGQTAGFSDSGDDFHRVMVAKITSSSPSVIVDAERVADGVERRHITCAPSEEAPDLIPG